MVRTRTVGGVILLAFAAIGVPLEATAATITVNTTADNTTAGDGQCTLREAIGNVNAAADTTTADCVAGTGAGDTIEFNVFLPAIVRLRRTLGQLAISQNVSITGPAMGSLTIIGRGSRVFEIITGATNMSNLTIKLAKEGSLLSGDGGGILVDNGANLALTNCTLRGNRSGHGGGISNAGTVILTNCTLSANRSYGVGSCIYNDGTAILTNCTLSGRRGHGISCIYNAGTTILANTIVAYTPARTGFLTENCMGAAITSNGHNISSDVSCFTASGTDLINTDPILYKLGNYGGPSNTMALCSEVGVPAQSCIGVSPAIDAGDDAVTGPPDNLTTDQRGLPRRAGLHVDIGAYEAQ